MIEFKGKNQKDLIAALTDKKEVLKQFRFEISGGKAKNVKLGKNIKKEIAQIMTELNNQKAITA